MVEILPFEDEQLNCLALQIITQHFAQVYEISCGTWNCYIFFDDDDKATLQRIFTLKNRFQYYTESLILSADERILNTIKACFFGNEGRLGMLELMIAEITEPNPIYSSVFNVWSAQIKFLNVFWIRSTKLYKVVL